MFCLATANSSHMFILLSWIMSHDPVWCVACPAPDWCEWTYNKINYYFFFDACRNGMKIHGGVTLVVSAHIGILMGGLVLNYFIYSRYMHRVHWQDERMNKWTKGHNDQMNERTRDRINKFTRYLKAFCWVICIDYQMFINCWVSTIN